MLAQGFVGDDGDGVGQVQRAERGAHGDADCVIHIAENVAPLLHMALRIV